MSIDKSEFQNHLKSFVEAAQQKVDARFAKSPSQSGKLSTSEGPKYVKVLIETPQRSVYCFVEKSTGHILKAAGWSAPAKSAPRSNIFDDDYGVHGVDGYGANYLRG